MRLLFHEPHDLGSTVQTYLTPRPNKGSCGRGDAFLGRLVTRAGTCLASASQIPLAPRQKRALFYFRLGYFWW